MSGLRKKDRNVRFQDTMQSMHAALEGFELESRQACRALRISIAIDGFGVGSLLPNELPVEQVMATGMKARATQALS